MGYSNSENKNNHTKILFLPFFILQLSFGFQDMCFKRSLILFLLSNFFTISWMIPWSILLSANPLFKLSLKIPFLKNPVGFLLCVLVRKLFVRIGGYLHLWSTGRTDKGSLYCQALIVYVSDLKASWTCLWSLLWV